MKNCSWDFLTFSRLHSTRLPEGSRECVSTGLAGARTRRSLGHHLLHPLILRPRALFDRTDCTRRSKFLTHTLQSFWIILLSPNICWEITNTIQHWRLGIFGQIAKRCNFMHEIFRMFFRQVYNLFPIRCAAGQKIRDHMCPSEGRKKNHHYLIFSQKFWIIFQNTNG